jgi:hypothetical protein
MFGENQKLTRRLLVGIVKAITEKMKKTKSNEDVEEITIIIDAGVKEVFEAIINKSGNYKNYTELLRDALFIGIKEIVQSIPKE